VSEEPEALTIPIRKRSPEEVRRRLRLADLPPGFVEFVGLLTEELGAAFADEAPGDQAMELDR